MMPIIILNGMVLCSLFLTFGSLGASGQETRNAVLVDEFGAVSCEDFLARMDYFISELTNNPADIGYLLISEKGRNPAGFLKFATANLYNRGFDRSRVKIYLTKLENSDVHGSFWRVPPGTNVPRFSSLHTPEPDSKRAFEYGSTFVDNVCPSFSPDLFAEFIRNNPGSKAQILIEGSTVYERLQAKKDVLDILGKVKLPRDRIVFYFVHRPKQGFSSIEYWYIPPKKR